MTDLLSSSEKAAISSGFDDLHDTFKRAITVFTKVAPSSSITSNSNYLFGKTSAQNPSEPSVTTSTIYARVFSRDKMDVGKIPGINSGSNIALPEGSIRLKISESDYALVKKSVKIEYNGLPFVLHSDAGKIGPFDINYYTLYFKRADT